MVIELKNLKNRDKINFLNVVPGGWTIVELNEIANRITTKNKGTISTNVLTISAQHGLVSQLEYFNKQVASKNLEGYYLLEKKDFSYNKSYSKGYPMGAIKPLVLYDHGVVSSLYICFRIIEEKTNFEYMKQYFNSTLWHQEVANIAQEGARNHGLLNVSVKEFFNIKLLLPSLNEQKKIVEILLSADEQIEKTNQLIEKTRELKKGLMQHLLTKGIGHSKFKQTEIGEIPIGWKLYSLSDVTTKVTIGLVTTMTKFYTEKGSALIRNSDIKEGKVLKENLIKLDESFAEKHKSKRLWEDDIVTVHTGDIGTSAMITKDLEGAHGFATLNTTVNKDLINPEYLMIYFNSVVAKNQFYSVSTGDGRNNLNLKDFINTNVTVPNSLVEQKKITDIINAVNEQIEGYEKEKEKQVELKKELMQQLLTGKLRVTV